MKVTEMLLTSGNTHGRTGTKLVPKGIVVHYVGNPGSSAVGNRNWFENGAGGAYTSAHYIIGLDGEIILCVPEYECAQHAGKSYAPQYDAQAKKNNSMYIGIENCHPNADGKFNDKTYASLVALCADICIHHGFDVQKDVVRHYDVTGKMCPMYYVKNSNEWESFKKDIQVKVDERNKPENVKFDLFHANQVVINGFIKDGTTYVEARDLLEKMGFNVGWDAVNKMVMVNK